VLEATNAIQNLDARLKQLEKRRIAVADGVASPSF
jgi:hypothetical protein